MFLSFLVRLVALAAAFAVTAWLVPDVDVEGGAVTYLWLALVFGLVNAVLGPILRLVSLPLTILTLGLFSLVVNGILLATVAGLTDSLTVGNFGWTIVAAVVLAIAAAVFDMIASRLVPGSASA